MATKKTQVEPQKKSNKFRLVVFEGDLSDGSISELAQALTSALKPTAPTIIRQLPKGNAPAQLLAPEQEEEVEDDEDTVIDGNQEEQEEPTPTASVAPKTPRTKKPPKPPTYLPDLITDMAAFKEFAKQKAPKSKNQQYLVAAYWLKKFGGVENVSADMVYTCYKSAPWSAGFNDWSQTFHNLVHAELMRKVGKGEFAINPTGEHQVDNPTA
jgi:hypothetical protein